MKIAGKIALVTGASSGIGRDTAIDLARRGATVAICARRADRLEETLEQCRRHAPGSRAYTCDVRDREQIRRTVAATRADLGPIDVLINNAGVSVYHLFTEAPETEFEEMMRANYFSALYFTREVMPSMIERHTGAVVFISSFAGRIATWRHTAYSASKFAMTGLAEALFYEVKSRGVHVAVIYPGVIRTEIFDKGEGFEHLRHVVEPQFLGTEVVTRAIAKAIEKERFELFAPERYTIIWKLRALFPRTIMKGTLRFVAKKFEPSP
jgi:short-subunit dehydrogenase